jgi:hypothetical protein
VETGAVGTTPQSAYSLAVTAFVGGGMGFRSFTGGFFSFLVIFVGINALIWFGWTREITDPHRNSGDLLRIGYILGYESPHQNIDDLPRRHIRANEYKKQPVDMVTVGDSYSIGGGGGRNSHYQDYIASLQGLTVLNAPVAGNFGNTGGYAPVLALSRLINSGYLDIIKPKYVLLESGERYAIQRLTSEFTLQETATIEEIDGSIGKPHVDEKQTKNALFDFHFINDGNWKFIGNNLQYLFSDKAVGSKVIISKLNRRFFSSDRGDQLIFHKEDAKHTKYSTPAGVAEANQNLNRLAAVLKAKGITLVFMPIVNKLNLYEPYLRKQRYPRSIFFEELRKLPKEYLLIDTKEILSRALEKGELDIYHQGDSHWTWKASEAIFSSIRISEMDHAAH